MPTGILWRSMPHARCRKRVLDRAPHGLGGVSMEGYRCLYYIHRRTYKFGIIG
jgi:hypothetical protein